MDIQQSPSKDNNRRLYLSRSLVEHRTYSSPSKVKTSEVADDSDEEFFNKYYKDVEERQTTIKFESDDDEESFDSEAWESRSLPSILNPEMISRSSHLSVKHKKLIHKRYDPRTFFALQKQKSTRNRKDIESRFLLPHERKRFRRSSNKSLGVCCDPSKKYYRWWILYFACWISFGSYIFYYSIAALNSDLKKGMNINDSQLGMLYSVTNIASIFMVFFAGIVVDKIGLRKSAFFYTLLISLGSIVFSIGLSDGPMKSFYVLMVGRFIFGIGSDSATVVQDCITAVWFRGRGVAIAMGFASSAGALGEIFSFLLLGELSTWMNNYSYVFWFTSFMCIGCFISANIFIILDRRASDNNNKESDSESESNESPENFHIKGILYFPKTYWLITIICVCFYSSAFSFTSFAPDFFESKYGYTQAYGGRLTSIISISSVILGPILGWLLDKYGKHLITISIGTILYTSGFIWFYFMINSSYVIVPMIMIGISYGLVSAAIWPCMVMIVDNEYFGTAYGLTTALLNVGSVFINYGIGYLINKSDHDTVIILWGTLGILSFIFSIIWNFVDFSTGGLGNSPPDEMQEGDEEYDDDDKDDDDATSSDELLTNH